MFACLIFDQMALFAVCSMAHRRFGGDSSRSASGCRTDTVEAATHRIAHAHPTCRDDRPFARG
jgi:hypothetical protein